MGTSALIARQPICNTGLKVVGYELLYRMNKQQNHAIISDGDSATIDVLLAAYNDMAIEDVVGTKLAFVNFTANLLKKPLPIIPPRQLVVELLEDQEVTPDLIRSLKSLRAKGYKVALDDFCLNQETIALIDCADIIKLDVMSEKPENWEPYISNLKDRGITMLAEKVETYDIYEQCVELGFTLFQGYFFSKPKVIEGKRMSRNETTVFNLIGKLNAKEVNFDEVVEIITSDVGLSYNLLRVVNSGMYSLSTQITSVRQAAVSLGLEHLKNWINMLSISSLDSKPQVLLDAAMLRAKMTELVGEQMNEVTDSSEYFTAGLLSVIDAFFDTPMEQLLEKLSLTDSLNKALLEHKGKIGHALYAVDHHYKGKFKNEDNFCKHYGISYEQLTQCYLNSIKWVEENRP